MRLADIITFRRDLLFSGAVQLGWLETDEELARKAAEHYAFHGPSYHGVTRDDRQGDGLQLIDTATFTLDILERLIGRRSGDPFALAIAGYGTGKSHLGVTLASLLSDPQSEIADKILDNLRSVDRRTAEQVHGILDESQQPFLVIAINGMRDFDLTGEIVRQVMLVLRRRGLDTSALEDLRPRFKYAINFAESHFGPFEAQFHRAFGDSCSLEDIVERLRNQDEDAFQRVSAIYEDMLGSSIRAVGQESLHEFLRAANEAYCGEGKPFAGILILFDEFGRYLEFAVQRPKIAGPGALQQLFESVQANPDGVFLLCFIQYELTAYVSRVAPELRDDLQRYVTRYDSVRKVRLSTNLETLIANLLEKRDPDALSSYVASLGESASAVQSYMRRWFPEIENNAVWTNPDTFDRVVREGCWPLHPLSTWLLYRLASVGKSLQQRSALSLLGDVFNTFQNVELDVGFAIAPVDLCNDALLDEFLASERFGQQGASAHACRSVLSKYENHLSTDEIRVLKAVLLMGKVSTRLGSREDCLSAIARFSGRSNESVAAAVRSLESDKGALTWNEAVHQYEILSDAVPRAQFLSYIEGKIADITADKRGEIFGQHFVRWFPQFQSQETDFGANNNISTREWNYAVTFANVTLLENQINMALRNWSEARGVDEPKGQLIYCYVGRNSDLSAVMDRTRIQLKSYFESEHISWEMGAPIALSFLYDDDGSLGKKVAEYWILQGQMDPRDAQRYANFILDRKNSLQEELRNQFEQLRQQRQMVFATGQEIKITRISPTLNELFGVVYPKRIPFPFDGFSTANGNAARDCRSFTRELFHGHFDKEWIATQPVQTKNRAFDVLIDSWGALDGAGSVRIEPAHAAVRGLIGLLDSWLKPPDGAEQPVSLNLGNAMRVLCAPPYGCNIASAGLVLALFVCPRNDSLELLKGGQKVSVETWLQTALPRNYLELSVLDQTVVIQVSEDEKVEWERLLDAWERENVYSGKVDFVRKARELEERIPIPAALFYRYKIVLQSAQQARSKISEYEESLNDALSKVESGVKRDDVNLLSWGGAELADLHVKMTATSGRWTGEQVADVERHKAVAKIKTLERFERWRAQQRANSIAEIHQFSRRMDLIAGNLDKLGLADEKRALEEHASKVREQVEFLVKVRRLAADFNSLTRANVIGDSMPINVLNRLLERTAEFEDLLAEARQRNVDLADNDLKNTTGYLGDYKQACKEQIKRHKQRAEVVYNAEVKSLQDISRLRAEMATIRLLFAGQDSDLGDFDIIQRQLDCAEEHYRRLDSDRLSNEEFEVILKECAAATERELGADGSPLDNECLYYGIAATIREKRKQVAGDWMRRNMRALNAISSTSAGEARQMKSILEDAPNVLSSEQKAAVRDALAACERRLDQLEVDGLVARFQALSHAARKAFLMKIGVAVGN